MKNWLSNYFFNDPSVYSLNDYLLGYTFLCLAWKILRHIINNKNEGKEKRRKEGRTERERRRQGIKEQNEEKRKTKRCEIKK